jgi:hypothetical protein
VEILQDDKIRNHLNPHARQDYEPTPHQTQPQPNQHRQQQPRQHQNARFYPGSSGHNNDFDDEPQIEDEDELLEMMAMQEECRMEMMKFYIQSQNPSLFEEIYHDVSYPEAMKKKEELAAASSAAAATAQQSSEKTPVADEPATEQLAESVSVMKINEQAANTSGGDNSESLDKIKEQVLNNLDTKSDEYKPEK